MYPTVSEIPISEIRKTIESESWNCLVQEGRFGPVVGFISTTGFTTLPILPLQVFQEMKTDVRKLQSIFCETLSEDPWTLVDTGGDYYVVQDRFIEARNLRNWYRLARLIGKVISVFVGVDINGPAKAEAILIVDPGMSFEANLNVNAA